MSHDPAQIYAAYEKDYLHDMNSHLGYLRAVGRGTVLEIGVRGGVSTACFLLSKADHVYSVDIDERCADLYRGHPKWSFIHADSTDTDSVYHWFDFAGGQIEQLDILFIDGNHAYEGLKADLNNYHTLVQSGGLILVHDVTQHNVGSVTPEQLAEGWASQHTTRAYNEFCGQHPEYRSQVMPGLFGLGVIYV